MTQHFILCSICHRLKASSDDPRICLDCAIEIADIANKARPLYFDQRDRSIAARMPFSDYAALSTDNLESNERYSAGRLVPLPPRDSFPEPNPIPPQETLDDDASMTKFALVVIALVVLFVAPIIACAIARPDLFSFKSSAQQERDLQLTWFYKGVEAACIFDIVGDGTATAGVLSYCREKIAQYRESHFDSFFDLPLSGDVATPESLRPSSHDRAMRYRSLIASTSSSAVAALQVFDALQVTLPGLSPIAFFSLTLVFSLGVIAVGVVLYRRGE